MNLRARLDQIEKRTAYSKHAPVLFLQSSEELGQKRHKIGPGTVVFLYDWEEDEPHIPECGAVIIDDIPEAD